MHLRYYAFLSDACFNTFDMKKTFLILTALSAFLISEADTVKLKNGDRISGTFSQAQMSDSAALNLDVKTIYDAVVSIPKADIAEIISATKAVEEAKIIAEATAPKPDSTEAKAPVVRTWEDDYKEFIHEYVPSGWEFKLKAGLEYRESVSENLSYLVSFEGKKKWDEYNEFDFTIWYDYATEQPRGMPATKSADNYGVRTNYKRFFSKAEEWYFQNMLAYSVDSVKMIRDQVDEAVLIGRRLTYLDGELVINVSAGPAVRYTNAIDFHQKWAVLAMAKEDLTWRYHKYSRIEQSAYFGLNVTNWSRYTFDFRLGVVFDITDIVSLSCRYMYNYDNMISSAAQKHEQRLIFGLEMPFK